MKALPPHQPIVLGAQPISRFPRTRQRRSHFSSVGACRRRPYYAHWFHRLKADGFDVRVSTDGLGAFAAFRRLYIARLRAEAD